MSGTHRSPGKEPRGKTPSTRDLPDAELEILAVLWHRGESTVREVREAIHSQRPMTHGAALTLFGRLEEKGLIARTDRKVGKAHVYVARVRPDPTYRQKARDLVERLFSGSSVALVSSLFETRPPSDAEIHALQDLLDDLKRSNSARRTGEDPAADKGTDKDPTTGGGRS